MNMSVSIFCCERKRREKETEEMQLDKNALRTNECVSESKMNHRKRKNEVLRV